MIRSALIATSAFLLLLSACDKAPLIEITATRASSSQQLELAVCSTVEGDCQLANAQNSSNIFNSAADTAVVAINLGDHTMSGMMYDKVQLEFSPDSSPCLAVTVPVKTGSTVKFTAALDAADALTFSCVAAGTCSGGATLCSALVTNNADLSVPLDSGADGGT